MKRGRDVLEESSQKTTHDIPVEILDTLGRVSLSLKKKVAWKKTRVIEVVHNAGYDIPVRSLTRWEKNIKEKMKRGAQKPKRNPNAKKTAKDLDQYYTKPDVANRCIESLETHLKISLAKFSTILEPSYGDGAFINGLKERGITEPKLFYVDIDASDPKHKADFLSDNLGISKSRPFLTIGNPPFGKNSSLAIDFFNKASKMSDVIAFILPRTFRKSSCVNRLDRNMFLVYERILDRDSFLFQGNTYSVPCVFQIWCHSGFVSSMRNQLVIPSNKLRPIQPKMTQTEDFKFVSLHDNVDFAIRRVGVNAGRIFDESPAEKSKESHLFIRVFDRSKVHEVFENLKGLNLESIESKYDTAGNPSICKDEICRLYKK